MADFMAEPPNVRLKLSNRSENVLLVREMLTGVSETVELDSSDLYDIRTAVTEACNNVVLHAYEGQEGPLEVDLSASAEVVEVVVRDRGIGNRPRIRGADDAALGIGLPLIQALVHSVQFSEVDGGGTEVRMHFLAPSGHALEPVPEDSAELPAGLEHRVDLMRLRLSDEVADGRCRHQHFAGRDPSVAVGRRKQLLRADTLQ